MHLQGDMYRVLPGMLRVWSGFPLACPFRVVPPAASCGHEWHMNGQLLGHRYLMQSFASCFRCTSIHHQVQTIWSREAVLSRHTSTALSMAAAFASASAPGIFAPCLLSNECAHKNHKCQIPNHSAQVISLSCFKCQASICNHENDADKLYNDSEDIKHFTPSHDKSCFRRFYLFFFLSLEILWTRFC